MTPVKSIRPATEEETAKSRIRGEHGKFTRLADSIIPHLENGQSAVVEVILGKGERKNQYQAGLSHGLRRKGQEVEVRQLKPVDDQPESEIHFLIKRREREQ